MTYCVNHEPARVNKRIAHAAKPAHYFRHNIILLNDCTTRPPPPPLIITTADMSLLLSRFLLHHADLLEVKILA